MGIKTKDIWVGCIIKSLQPTFCRCSTRALWVTVDTTTLILPASSGKVISNGGMYTVSSIYSQNRKSRTVRSGKCVCLCSELFYLGQLHVTNLVLIHFKHFSWILCTIVCGMFNCWAACLVDFSGLWTEATWTSSTWSSVTWGLLASFASQMQPVWSNNFSHLWIEIFVGDSLWNTIQNCFCTVTTELDSEITVHI